MWDLSDIRRPVEKELQRFESELVESCSSEAVSKSVLGSVLPMTEGKRLRPMLVFLFAKLFGDSNESTHRAALFVEMLHTATLIHDDIVDGSAVRRGKPAVHIQWDVPSAVLTGDFLLAKAMLLLSNDEDLPLLQELLVTILAMSEGELMQKRSKKLEARSKEEYLEVIQRKTAMLFRSCCVVGALSVHASSAVFPLIADFGLHLGFVFQMRDDILDQDDPASVAYAEALFPQYFEKAQTALNLLTPNVKDQESMVALEALLCFCAQRNV